MLMVTIEKLFKDDFINLRHQFVLEITFVTVEALMSNDFP